MSNRRHRIRPAEPHEVVEELAAAFLAATTVPRRPRPTARQVLRDAVELAVLLLIGVPLGLASAFAIFYVLIHLL
ncbi:hypothetical protein [Nocardiopsis potens]|uniref:hypothetical protein n=1 Tax=Nocardiopsis potens TaxID=1246458 RepID=UPI000348178D|nr:hypothetical protein [Nocardiopsis potens]